MCFFFTEDARVKFKQYVNKLAQTKTDGDQKYLILKTKYHNSLDSFKSSQQILQQSDPRISLGIPVSPSYPASDYSLCNSPAQRQPPPYRPPPPVISPTNSLDNISLSSIMSHQDVTPQAPPRRRTIDKQKSMNDELMSSTKQINGDDSDEKQTVSVKERMEKFNRMASMEDELSPRCKTTEKSKVDKVSCCIFLNEWPEL